MSTGVRVVSTKPSKALCKSKTNNISSVGSPKKVVEESNDSSSPEVMSESEIKVHSPNSKWHEKCIESFELKKTKTKEKQKKKTKNNSEVIRFVEGIRPTAASDVTCRRRNDCSKLTTGDVKRRNSKYNTQVRFLEHKFVQCNISRESNEIEVSLPEEIKPLLINITFLLHELKQRSELKNNEDLCNLITKIVTLLTELSRRPIKEFNKGVDQPKPFDEIAEKLGNILEEYIGTNNKEYESMERDIELLGQRLTQRDSDVNYVKEQIIEERSRLMSDSNELSDCLRNSFLKNLSMKAEIKFNQGLFKKYSKIMAQKDQLKQKSDMELNCLRRKYAKQEQASEIGLKPVFLRLSNTENEVSPGGSLTKYIKSKVTTEKKVKRKTTRTK